MNITQQAENATAAGDHPALVIPTYLIVFLPWAIVQTIDFISSEWKTVQQTRRQGLIHMFILTLPIIILTFYIYFQIKAADYKEMSAAILAVIISMTQLMRTWWGLWQLEQFKKWAAQSIRIMESHGYQYKLSDVDEVRYNTPSDSTTEETNSNSAENKDRDSSRFIQSQSNDSEQHDDTNDYEIWKAKQLEKCEKKAEQIKVNDSVIDNQIAGGAARCYVEFRDMALLKLPPQQKRPLLSYVLIPLDFIHIFLIRLLVDPVIYLGKWFDCLKPFAKRYQSRLDSFHQKPYEPVEVWINWATVFVSQGLKEWIEDFHVVEVPPPQDGVTADGYEEQRDYFAGEVLSMGLMMMQRDETDNSSAPEDGNISRHCSGRYGPGRHLNYLPVEEYERKLEDNAEDLNNDRPMRRVKKQDLLIRALESGEGLPFNAKHLTSTHKENTESIETTSQKSRLRGKVESNTVVEYELRRYGYKPYEHDLKRTVEILPPKFGSQVLEFDIERLEWLTIFLFLGINDHSKSDGASYSLNVNNRQDNPPDDKQVYELTENDTPVKMLKLQLGFNPKTPLLRFNSHEKQCCKALTFPMEKVDQLQLSEANRNVTRVSEAIDVWMALDAGASFNFLLKYEPGMELECLFESPENRIFTSRDTLQWELDYDISDRESYHRAAEYAKKVDTEWNPLMVSHVVTEQRRLEAEFGMKSRENGDYSQSFSFLGIMMEHVRSSLARRVNNGDDCLTPKIPFVDDGLVTSDILNVRLSESFGCAIAECFPQIDGSDKVPSPWSDLLKGRLILELQEHCKSLWQNNESISVTSSISRSTSNATTIVSDTLETSTQQEDTTFDDELVREVGCVLGFPSLWVSKLRYEDNCDSGPSGSPTVIDFNKIVCSIHTVCGPQRFSIGIKFMRQSQSVIAKVRLERQDTNRDSRFVWEAWRDAHLGRLEGKRQWQVGHGMRSEQLCFSTFRLSEGVKVRELQENGLGNRMKVFEGWKPARPDLSEFEFRSKDLILTDQYLKSKLESNERTHGTERNEFTKKMEESEIKLQRVPVSYHEAATHVMTYTSEIIAQILPRNGLPNRDGSIVDSSLSIDSSNKMDEVEILMSDPKNRDKGQALQILETEIEEENIDALEKSVEILTESGSGRGDHSRALLLVKRFQSILLISDREEHFNNLQKRIVRKLVLIYKHLVEKTNYDPKVVISFSQFLRNILHHHGQTYAKKFLRYIRMSFQYTGNLQNIGELSLWSMRRDDGRRRTHLDKALIHRMKDIYSMERDTHRNVTTFFTTDVAYLHMNEALPWFQHILQNGDSQAILDGVFAITSGSLNCEKTTTIIIEKCAELGHQGMQQAQAALRNILRSNIVVRFEHRMQVVQILESVFGDSHDSLYADAVALFYERGGPSFSPELNKAVDTLTKMSLSIKLLDILLRIIKRANDSRLPYVVMAFDHIENSVMESSDMAHKIGSFFEHGTRWIEPNLSKAVKFYSVSTDHLLNSDNRSNISLDENSEARSCVLALLRMMRNASNLGREDRATALQCLTRAAEEYQWIWYELGLLYEEGISFFSKDMNKAVRYYGKVSTQENAINKLLLAVQDETDAGFEYQRKALQHLHTTALDGSSSAALKLGTIYEEGNSWIESDPSKAIEIYGKSESNYECYGHLARLARESNNDNSLYHQEAFRRLQEGASNGENYAEYHLGSVYENGSPIVEQDLLQAVKLYGESVILENSYKSLLRIIQDDRGDGTECQRIALQYLQDAAIRSEGVEEPNSSRVIDNAQSGHGRGPNNIVSSQSLGAVYEAGTSWIPRDITKAIQLYCSARSHLRNECLDDNLKRIAQKHIYNATEYTQEVVNEFRAMAENGDSELSFALGLIYDTGTEAIDQDLRKSVHLLGIGAMKGHWKSARALIRILYQHDHLDETIAKSAIEFLQKCVDGVGFNRKDIPVFVGYIYEHGIGSVKQNLSEAFRWYQQSNSVSDWDVWSPIIGMIRFDEQTGSDSKYLKRAFERLQEAADTGNVNAAVALGSLYEHGTRVVPRDLLAAAKQYKRGGEKLDPDAIQFLFHLISDNLSLTESLRLFVLETLEQIIAEENSFFKKAPHFYFILQSYLERVILRTLGQITSIAEENSSFKKEPHLSLKLGRLFEHGSYNIPPDLIEAVRLYSAASDGGNRAAQRRLMRVSCSKIDADVTGKEIAFDSLSRNLPFITDDDFSLLVDGGTTPLDRNKAVAAMFHERTVAADQMDATEALIWVLRRTENVQNEQQSIALRLLKTITKFQYFSDNDSLYQLGYLYEDGTVSIEQDISEAVRLYVLGSQRVKSCRNAIVRIIRDSAGVDETTMRKSISFVQQRNNDECRRILASLWEHGSISLEKDLVQALHIYGDDDDDRFFEKDPFSPKDLIRILLNNPDITSKCQQIALCYLRIVTDKRGGDASSLELGKLYEHGTAQIAPDLMETIRTYRAVPSYSHRSNLLRIIRDYPSISSADAEDILMFLQNSITILGKDINELANLYEHGTASIERNIEKAAELYGIGASEGHYESFEALVRIIYSDVNDRIKIRSLKCIQQASTIYDHAKHILGYLYDHGSKILSADMQTALHLYLEASANFHHPTTDVLLRLCQTDIVLGPGQKEAIIRCLWEAAVSKNLGVAYAFALIYEQGGVLVNLDLSKAIELHGLAATFGNIYSLRALVSIMCDESDTNETQRKNALRYIQKAGFAKGSQVSYEVAMLYERGAGLLKKDLNKAVQLHCLCASDGNEDSQKALTRILNNHSGVEMRYKDLALRSLSKIAETKAALAYELGCLHEKQNFAEKEDKSQAARFYSMAARDGHTKGIDSLSRMVTDHNEAAEVQRSSFHYLQEASDFSTGAAYRLGCIYEKGCKLFPCDMSKAVRLYGRTSFSGHLESTKALIRLLRHNPKIPEMHRKSCLQYLREAVDGDNSEAAYLLAEMYEDGDMSRPENINEVLRLYGVATIAKHSASTDSLFRLLCDDSYSGTEHQATILRFLGIAISEGHHEAAYRLGSMYEEGTTPNGRDIAEAVRQYCIAASTGHSNSIKTLVSFLRGERGEPTYHTIILPHIRRAVIDGNGEAAFLLGSLYEKGMKEVNPDRDEALRLYGNAAIVGDSEGTKMLVRVLKEDIWQTPNKNTALMYLRLAILRDHKLAAYELGCLLENGNDYLSRNTHEAVRLFGRASIAGHVQSTKKLASFLRENPDMNLRDQQNCLQYLGTSVTKGSLDAIYMLGRICEEGTDWIVRNMLRVVDLYGDAAMDKHEKSCKALKRIVVDRNLTPRIRSRAEWYLREISHNS